MLNKTKIAVATALVIIGTAGAALASNDHDGEDSGGYRLLAPGGVVTDGANPVYHRSLRAGAGSAYGYAPEHTKHTTK
jgi:hypothetical protein